MDRTRRFNVVNETQANSILLNTSIDAIRLFSSNSDKYNLI